MQENNKFWNLWNYDKTYRDFIRLLQNAGKKLQGCVPAHEEKTSKLKIFNIIKKSTAIHIWSNWDNYKIQGKISHGAYLNLDELVVGNSDVENFLEKINEWLDPPTHTGIKRGESSCGYSHSQQKEKWFKDTGRSLSKTLEKVFKRYLQISHQSSSVTERKPTDSW